MGTVTKEPIGKQDFSLWDGTSAKTFLRQTSEGYDLTLNKVDWPGIDVLQVFGGGGARSSVAIAAAVSALTGTVVPLWLSPGTWAISASVSFEAGTIPIIPPGSIFSIDAGKTLTFSGNHIQAGGYQIFSGAGSISFADGTEVRSSWFASLSAAIGYISTKKVKIIIDRSETISGDLTVPNNVCLSFQKGAVLSIANSKTLTINGPIEAGAYQIFSGVGTGKVAFGSTSDVFPVWCAAGLGTSGAPWTGWDTAIAWAGGVKYIFNQGYYSYATAPNWALAGIQIEGQGLVYLKHTGSGLGVDFTSDTNVYECRARNLRILGNDNTTIGFSTKHVHHSSFEDITILKTGAAGIGIASEFGVANIWKNPQVSVNVADAGTMPATGILFTRDGAGENTTDCTVINPIMEGLTGVGIKIDYGNSNTFIGGTSEANGKGLQINNESQFNSFLNLYCEINTTHDVHIVDGNGNYFYSSFNNAGGGSPGVGTITIDVGEGNGVYGGLVSAITIGAGASFTSVINVQAATITDNGVSSLLLGNWTGSTIKDNKIPGVVTQTAWTAPSLQSSWANVGGLTPAGYFKDTFGVVHMRGAMNTGTYADGTLIFTLASGNRPAYATTLECGPNGVRVLIGTDGTVKIYGAASASLILDGVSFETF